MSHYPNEQGVPGIAHSVHREGKMLVTWSMKILSSVALNTMGELELGCTIWRAPAHQVAVLSAHAHCTTLLLQSVCTHVFFCGDILYMSAFNKHIYILKGLPNLFIHALCNSIRGQH